MNKLNVRTELVTLPETVLMRLKKPVCQVLNRLYDRWDSVSNFGVACEFLSSGDFSESPMLEPRPSVSCSAHASLCSQESSVSLSTKSDIPFRNIFVLGLTTDRRQLRSFGSHLKTRNAFILRSVEKASFLRALLWSENCRLPFFDELCEREAVTDFQLLAQKSHRLPRSGFKRDHVGKTGVQPVDISEISLEEHHCSVAVNLS